MAITRVNTPAIIRSTSVTPSAATVTWGTYPPRWPGICWSRWSPFGGTSCGAPAQYAGTSGWTNVVESRTPPPLHSRVAVWTKIAAGADAWPRFTSTMSGPAHEPGCAVAIARLNRGNGSFPVRDVRFRVVVGDDHQRAP